MEAIYHWQTLGWTGEAVACLLPIEGSPFPQSDAVSNDWETMMSREDKINPYGNQCSHWKATSVRIPQIVDITGNNLTRTSTYTSDGKLTPCRRYKAGNRIALDQFDGGAIGISDGYTRYSIYLAGNTIETIYSYNGETFAESYSAYFRWHNGNLQSRNDIITVHTYPDGHSVVENETHTTWDSFWDSYYWYRVNNISWGSYPDIVPGAADIATLAFEKPAYFLPDYQELCARAVDNTRVNHANMLSLPRELLNTITGKEAIKLAGDLLRNCSKSNFEGITSLATSLYLNGRFGAKLSGIELGQFMENQLQDNQWRAKLHGKSRGTVAYQKKVNNFVFECSSSLTFSYTFKGFNYLFKRWDNASLPTLSDVWDVIPYSFVVDWATGIGDMLTAYERNRYMSHADVSNIWQTAHLHTSKSVSTDAGISTLDLHGFIRVGKPGLVSTSMKVGPAGTTRNLADLTALFIQGK